MADAPTVNALKDISKALQDQTRALQKIDSDLLKISKLLEAINTNYVEVNRHIPKEQDE